MSEITPQHPPSEEPVEANEVLDFLNKEVAIRRYRVETDRQEKQQAHEYAMRAIDAQERTLALAISTDATDRKRRYTLWGSTLGAIILLIMFLVWQGNGKLAEEIAKALLFLISGGFGGWGWAKRQQENKQNTP